MYQLPVTHMRLIQKEVLFSLQRSRVQVWLYEQTNLRIEGCIVVSNIYHPRPCAGMLLSACLSVCLSRTFFPQTVFGVLLDRNESRDDAKRNQTRYNQYDQ